MMFTILRISVYFDGDLLAVAKVNAENVAGAARLLGVGILKNIKLRVEGELRDCHETQSDVLIMEGMPRRIPWPDIQEVSDQTSYQVSYSKSLRIV